MSNPKQTKEGNKYNPHGYMFFAIPSSISGRMHLAALQFDSLEEWAQAHAYGINKGYLPVLAPQAELGPTFDARMAEPKRTAGDRQRQPEIDEDGKPHCPDHGKDEPMLESKKEKGGYYCGRKTNGQRCGWEWSPKRGLYQVSGKGA